jgi:hypothetical protein
MLERSLAGVKVRGSPYTKDATMYIYTPPLQVRVTVRQDPAEIFTKLLAAVIAALLL